jgi:hypothetical protein
MDAFTIHMLGCFVCPLDQIFEQERKQLDKYAPQTVLHDRVTSLLCMSRVYI